MNDYLLKTQDLPAHTAAGYHCLVHTGNLDGDAVVEILHDGDPSISGDVMIAQRIDPATEAEILDEDLYKQARPFGNNPDGSATGRLLYHHFAGWPTRVFDNGEEYPASDVPFDAEARHKYFDTPATPASTGWGFRVELIGSYDTRDPSARAIGVYSDSECTQYLWTTGALSLGESDWQVDADGEPLQVWYTDSWDGDRPDEQKDWHIAFLLGAAQEGHYTLPVSSDGLRYLFWEKTQGATGAEYVASGITVTNIYGAGVFGVSTSDGFVANEILKIDDVETEFVRVHAPGIIVVATHVATAVGKEIYWQR